MPLRPPDEALRRFPPQARTVPLSTSRLIRLYTASRSSGVLTHNLLHDDHIGSTARLLETERLIGRDDAGPCHLAAAGRHRPQSGAYARAMSVLPTIELSSSRNSVL